MNHEVFWTLIDNARTTGKNRQEGMCEALAEALSGMNPAEVAGFDRVLRELRAAAYRWDLWGAAHVLDGGCSDDGFEYFRNWLIGMGRKVYDQALANPDSLATAPGWLMEDGVHEFETLGYVAMDVYHGMTGKDGLPHAIREPAAPAGEEFDFEVAGEMRARYPRLAERYLKEE